jgi:signal transduction histidine kinase
MDEARQAVWNLRQSGTAELFSQLERMADQISHEFGIAVKCQVSGRPFGFDQSTVHEVLMVVREALYNAIRHGRPTAVRVEVEFAYDRCIVKVTDDGTGFDAAALSVSPNGHYGLIGIRERVERIGGRFSMDSRVGAGTRLVIEVPRTVEAGNEVAGIKI